MRLKSVILILSLALLFCFCNSSFQTAFSEKENIKFKVDSIIELMTLEWPEDEGSTIEGKERMDVDLTVSVEEDLARQTEQILGDEKK